MRNKLEDVGNFKVDFIRLSQPVELMENCILSLGFADVGEERVGVQIDAPARDGEANEALLGFMAEVNRFARHCLCRMQFV